VSLYELLLFVHVLAAAAWFGAALLAAVLLELAARAKDTPWLVRLGEYDEKLAPLLFIPAAIVTLLAGVALVFDGPWSFTGEGWVFAGLVLFAAIFALGLGLIVPAGKRLAALARADAPAAELQKQVGKLRLLNWIDVGLLAAAIFFMTAKPVN
jgi:uncharacterized membrane protein